MIRSRLVRAQLIIFSIVAVISMAIAGTFYLRIPANLGIGRYSVTIELPSAGGLYRNANVTYHGDTIGRVKSVDLTPGGVTATVSLIDSVSVPADLTVRVRSVSAVGEQYVDLAPSSGKRPYLHDGDVISRDKVQISDEMGPILDQTKRVLAAVPADKLRVLLGESGQAFGGAGNDMATLLDATTEFINRMAAGGDAAKTLIQQLTPLLDAQNVSSADIRAWTASMAVIAEQAQRGDPAVRDILDRGPGMATEVTQLFQGLRPTLPVLLANLTSTGQVAVTYNPALEQILVLLPPLIAAQNTTVMKGHDDGAAAVDFHLDIQDPPACTTGYLGPDQRRNATLLDSPTTPGNLYCKVPQNSPFAVRGMRNLPCLEVPGKRAPSPDLCRAGSYAPEGNNGPFELGPPRVDTARVLPASDTYVGHDGMPYHYHDKEGSWTSLLTNAVR